MVLRDAQHPVILESHILGSAVRRHLNLLEFLEQRLGHFLGKQLLPIKAPLVPRLVKRSIAWLLRWKFADIHVSVQRLLRDRLSARGWQTAAWSRIAANASCRQ